MQKNIIINTEDLQYYLKDIKKIPVMSHERQDEIFILLKNKKIPKSEKEKLQEELVKGNLRFVVSIAKLYQNQGMDILDLISEGNIGLLKSIQRFNSDKGLRFISYAVWWIRQAIMASLNENSRTIRIPSNVIQDAQKDRKNENDPHIITDKNVLIPSLPYCVGLHSEINDEGCQLIDLIRDPNEDNPENILNTKEEIRKKVDNMLRVLDDRERTIVEKYFGLNGIESNLEDLGEEFNCTKERIRQIKDRSLRKLRNESYNLLKYI